MNNLLTVEISQLSVFKRIQLAEDLWDSIAATPESISVTNAQRQELNRRLEMYYQNPASGSTWQEVKQRLINPA